MSGLAERLGYNARDISLRLFDRILDQVRQKKIV
jgi:hypothetical protein